MRYFFHVKDDHKLFRDKTGTVLPNEEVVNRQAAVIAEELAQDLHWFCGLCSRQTGQRDCVDAHSWPLMEQTVHLFGGSCRFAPRRGANPAVTTRRTASANWRTPKRCIMRARWTSTVLTLIPRSKAITLF